MEVDSNPEASESSQLVAVEQFLSTLTLLAQQPPSTEGFEALGGAIAAWLIARNNELPSTNLINVAMAYLRALTQLCQADIESSPFLLLAEGSQTEIFRATWSSLLICKNQPDIEMQQALLPRLAAMIAKLSQPNGFIMSPRHPALSSLDIEWMIVLFYAKQHSDATAWVTGTWPLPKAVNSSAEQVLQYYYRRGCVHAKYQDWSMAQRCFWICLSIPGQHAPDLLLQAWKKLVLVQCVQYNGTSRKNQSRMPPSSSVHMGNLASNNESLKWYQTFADAYYQRDKAKLATIVEEGAETLTQDFNTDLVELCTQQMVVNQVRHIAQMYSVISVPKLVTLLNLERTDDAQERQTVSDLLGRSGLAWEWQDEWIVFNDTKEVVQDACADRELSELVELMETIQGLDVAITTDPTYHSIIGRTRRQNVEDSPTQGAPEIPGNVA
eukprot:Nitzschia sp. Nitz4//scaffold43_size134323//123127//124546//NITZ4_003321-RA/size134323-augustus-gene-0.227-mRNA-1//1//CDS//3329552014//5035//frame0